MLEKEEVKKYFHQYPEAREIIENTEIQVKCWEPNLTHEEMYRKMTVDDVRYISFKGWEGQEGIFAWCYPCGVPTYIKIG